jgi:hypothetical protein
MTNKQYQYKQEQRKIRFELDGYFCQYPVGHHPGNQQAHRVAATKSNIKKFGFDFIYSNINLVTCCNQSDHNDYWNCGFNPAKSKKLYELYLGHKEEYSTTEYINSILG